MNWQRLRYRSTRVVMRPLCVIRRHKYWYREGMLTALAHGRSKRCRWCNRLVLKREYRTQAVSS